MKSMGAILLAAMGIAAAAACQHASQSGAAHGEPSPEAKAIQAGKRVPRSKLPLSAFNVYLDAFHAMKDDPSHALEAHHFCQQLTADLTQCVLFDGNTTDALMNGVEYIISERVFESLPPGEQKYWHPHNYEILSGQLILPGVPDDMEKQALGRMMNSYGKTWHFWNTPSWSKPGDALPLGEPRLAWSYNADGEAPQGMIDRRDIQFGVLTVEKKKYRRDLVGKAHPQEGVDALSHAFPRRRPIQGVVDKQSAEQE